MRAFYLCAAHGRRAAEYAIEKDPCGLADHETLPTLAVLLAMACCGTLPTHSASRPLLDNQAVPSGVLRRRDRSVLTWPGRRQPSFGGCFQPTLSQLAARGEPRDRARMTTVAHATPAVGHGTTAFPMVRRVCEFEAGRTTCARFALLHHRRRGVRGAEAPGVGLDVPADDDVGETGGPSLAAFAVDPSTQQCRPELVPVYAS
jgi:hypothetical protein